MTDVRLKGSVSLAGVVMDVLLRKNGLLDEREEFATAVRVALGTDALVSGDDILPDPDSTDRRGWWGDLEAQQIWNGWPIGVKNWLLLRAKILDKNSSEGSTLARAENYTREALQWFIDNRLCSRIDVKATRVELQRIDVDVTIYRGPIAEIDLRYQILWQEDDFIEVEETGEEVPPAQTNKLIRIPYRDLRLSSVAPVVARTFSVYTIDRRDLVLSGTAPIRSLGNIRATLQGNLALSSVAPIVNASGVYKVIPQGNLNRGGFAPTVTRTTTTIGFTPARRDLVLSPNFPTVTKTNYIYAGEWVGGTNYFVNNVVHVTGDEAQDLGYWRCVVNNVDKPPPSFAGGVDGDGNPIPQYWTFWGTHFP